MKSRECYEIVKDKEVLLDFIDWLPELKEFETYYVVLLSRKKYDPEGIKSSTSDRIQIVRFLSDKKHLYERILRLEAPIGSYLNKGEIISEQSLALYITPNPRNQYNCIQPLINRLLNLAFAKQRITKLDEEFLSIVHQTQSRRIYKDFDFDGVSLKEVMSMVEGCINSECLNFLETKGGVHLIVELSKIHKSFEKVWYNNLIQLEGLDTNDTNMIPVPGCTQGGFIPKLYKNYGCN